MAKSSDRIVFVLGMHRSGTSAITKGLEVLGVDLGENLVPANRNNAKGFFEDQAILDLNNQLLRAFGQTWYSLTPLPQGFEHAPQAKKFVSRAVAILNARRGGNPIGFKDPRLSKLLPLWLLAAQQAKLKPVAVIACRNPLSVINSLSKRDNFDPEKSALLWTQYTLDAVRHSQKIPRLVVGFDNMLKNPRKELTRMSNVLTLPLDPNSESVIEYATTFLDKALLSSTNSVRDLTSRDAIPQGVVDLYLLLELVSRDKLSLNSEEFNQRLVAIYPSLFDFAMAISDRGLAIELDLRQQLEWHENFIAELKTSKTWKLSQSYRRWVSRIKRVPPPEI